MMSFHSRLKQKDRPTGSGAAGAPPGGEATRPVRQPATGQLSGVAPDAGPDAGSGAPPRAAATGAQALMLATYLESLALVERMHRLLLDVIKDEFERLGIIDLNAVQALLLFNIGENEVSAGELKSRGYYQGSNVSYNLKKLVETGYMHHQRCAIDRRAVRVRLTAQGHEVRAIVATLFERHAEGLMARDLASYTELDGINMALRRLERFWSEQIRYIY